MRQRVAVARTWATSPRVILMDEPFAAVDAITRLTLQEELIRLASTTKCTVIFITHSVEEAVFLGDYVVAMTARPGRILEIVPIPKFGSHRTWEGMIKDVRIEAIVAKVFELVRGTARAAERRLMSLAITQTAPSATRWRYPAWLLQSGTFLALILIWEISARAINNPLILPDVLACLKAMGNLLARGTLVAAAQSSFATLLIGSSICIAVVVPATMLIAFDRRAAGLVQPLVRFISYVPAIALIPLFIVWFGFSQKAVYATLFYTSAIPLLFSVLTGVQKIPPAYASGLRTLGASKLRIIRDVYLPGRHPGHRRRHPFDAQLRLARRDCRRADHRQQRPRQTAVAIPRLQSGGSDHRRDDPDLHSLCRHRPAVPPSVGPGHRQPLDNTVGRTDEQLE